MNKNKLNGKIVIITGGAGLLGRQYVQAVKDIGGTPVVLDIDPNAEEKCRCYCINCDITNEAHIKNAVGMLQAAEPIYGLINNAAIDPKVVGSSLQASETRLEAFPRAVWDQEVAVGLTGAMLCTKHFGAIMARQGRGSIINISSVLGLVAPNQVLYKKEGIPDEQQAVKPITYSVIKHGIIGLTRYTATYWGSKGVRCNALCPGGVYNDHSEDFVTKLSKYIPLGRMANKDEYCGAIQFLLTDASSFMTGAILQIDGGQVTW